jgi:hypothetical protein
MCKFKYGDRPVYICVSKMFLKKIKFFYFFLLQINIFLVFSNYFDMLILKIIIFKKIILIHF